MLQVVFYLNFLFHISLRGELLYAREKIKIQFSMIVKIFQFGGYYVFPATFNTWLEMELIDHLLLTYVGTCNDYIALHHNFSE